MTMAANPWGLTAAEENVLRTLCEHGCHKLAARALNRSQKTIEAHLSNAAKKMPHRSPLARFIAFDRWDRERGFRT